MEGVDDSDGYDGGEFAQAFEEEFRKLVRLLRAKYANSPVFLDEIKSV